MAPAIHPSRKPVETQVEKHESMHLREVMFRVEDRRFKVPIQMFGDSEKFYAMLERVTSKDPDAKQYIHIDGIGGDEFLYFMKYLNYRRMRAHMDLNDAGYTAVLKFSTKWRFDLVRAAAIREFPDIDVVDKIALARDYCVGEWFVTSLNTYARLGRSVTLQDVERLGSNYVLKIVQVRESMDQLPVEDEPCTEVECRSKYNFAPSLTILFREEIDRSKFQSPSLIASDVEDFELVQLFFLVENHLFKSYRQRFEESPVFRQMFSLPVGENEIPDGTTESQPLRLAGIMRADFAPFVNLMNPGPLPEIDFSLTEWISILRLSTMWDFTGPREYAIAQISKLGISPARQINLARDYRIQEWLLPALNAYAQQANAITDDDIDLLGWECVLKLLQAREHMGVHVFYTGLPFYFRHGIDARVGYDFTEAIEEAFRDEIERMRQSYG